jgi:hypothetical protein
MASIQGERGVLRRMWRLCWYIFGHPVRHRRGNFLEFFVFVTRTWFVIIISQTCVCSPSMAEMAVYAEVKSSRVFADYSRDIYVCVYVHI